MVRFRLPTTLVLGLLLLGAIGCGGTYAPSGKLTKGGQPLNLTEKQGLIMAFYPESDKDFGDANPVKWEKDGTFKVTGKSGTGIPAGKYRVSIVIMDNYGQPNAKDILDGKFAKGNGPIVEVKDAKEIVIDVEKK